MRKRNYVKAPRSSRPDRRRRLIQAVAAVGGLFFLWSLIVGEMGFVKYYRMRGQEQSLRAEIGQLKADNLRLLQEVRALKYDAAYLERIARDKFGLARPGEIVYYYGDAADR